MEEFKLETEYINLTQLLKAARVISSGADAHYLILNGEVKVNGQVDNRKRAKLYRGDLVQVMNREIHIV